MAISNTPSDRNMDIDQVLKIVYDALAAKGYKPIPQICGYIMTGDPTYITPYNNARDLISKFESQDIACHLLEAYFKAD